MTRKELIKLIEQEDYYSFASRQPKGKAKYKLGDVVELTVGGYGIITKVSEPQSGWAAHYAIDKHPKLPFSKDGKLAWYFPLEIWKKVGGIVLQK